VTTKGIFDSFNLAYNIHTVSSEKEVYIHMISRSFLTAAYPKYHLITRVEIRIVNIMVVLLQDAP